MASCGLVGSAERRPSHSAAEKPELEARRPRAHGKSIVKSIPLTLAQIGNSRGIRLPAGLIRKHGLEQGLVLEDRGHEIVLTPKGGTKKLSWAETYQEMAAAGEDWSEWEGMLADGLDQVKESKSCR